MEGVHEIPSSEWYSSRKTVIAICFGGKCCAKRVDVDTVHFSIRLRDARLAVASVGVCRPSRERKASQIGLVISFISKAAIRQYLPILRQSPMRLSHCILDY